MKYGFNDYEWNKNNNGGALNAAINSFNVHGFIGFMKRKSVRDDELEMLAALKEMVEMMEAHANEIRK